MKLLQALFFPPEQPGGVSSMVPYILERFQNSNWDMDLFSIPKRVRGKGQDEVRFATFDWEEFKHNPTVQKYIQTFRDYSWWAKMRINTKYDLIHAHHPIPALVMKRLFPETPLIVTIHSSFERELVLNGKIKEGGAEHRFLTSLYRELEHCTDRVLTVSHSFRQYLAPYMDRPEEVTVIPNGFDEKRFKPVERQNEVPQLITVCRLVPAKGLDVLLEACAELKKRGHPFVLHLIGDGPIRTDLEALAVELNIYDEIIFYGYMLHPEQFMPFADIFVLPSRAEAFGSVFAEAALCRLGLIGTDVGGISEQIEDGVNGLLVPPDDKSALCDAMQRLIEDAELRSRLSYAAWEKAKETYSLTRVIDQLRNIYAQFMQG
ncbi:D-inositol-3-phosphate glycosyltransferase [Paenibacillus sp. CECT 9249]|uniref:glycosyltransferase family 4 protein n=1 Tax=Paenibacillus sp. CECT 9249 TaxID=2845385 RepID=UPI001E60F74F|nr:glycosyltransferase family 4 protein [Paenibacillus sp. CECT 9249]CAH0117566.1 D-inositol-3-phosphate glycosyltransferase [Paenibacillus sp. CECT 9249]